MSARSVVIEHINLGLSDPARQPLTQEIVNVCGVKGLHANVVCAALAMALLEVAQQMTEAIPVEKRIGNEREFFLMAMSDVIGGLSKRYGDRLPSTLKVMPP